MNATKVFLWLCWFKDSDLLELLTYEKKEVGP